MSNADRQKRYRDKQRNSQSVTESVSFAPAGVTGRLKNVTRVTPESDRNAPTVTPQDAPQSTNGGEVVVEHPQIAAMSDTDLRIRLMSYSGESWVGTPEHKEIMSRRKAAGAWA